MKKTTSLLLAAMVAGSFFTTAVMADAKKGQRFYLKNLKICKKDGLKNGAVFATKHSRHEWAKIKESGKIQDEWKSMCPHAVKKIDKMKEKYIDNLYDFVWKYASDGETPSCS
jgi:Spy/CpxP family protein refolding chaperone